MKRFHFWFYPLLLGIEIGLFNQEQANFNEVRTLTVVHRHGPDIVPTCPVPVKGMAAA